MPRNPIAKAVSRIHQQVVPDQREKLRGQAERMDAEEPIEKDLVRRIAMDISKEVVHHIEMMYPAAIEATSSSFKLSVRNCIHNEIMASLEVNEEGAIIARLDFRKKFRRHLKKLRNAGGMDELLAVMNDAPVNPALKSSR